MQYQKNVQHLDIDSWSIEGAGFDAQMQEFRGKGTGFGAISKKWIQQLDLDSLSIKGTGFGAFWHNF